MHIGTERLHVLIVLPVIDLLLSAKMTTDEVHQFIALVLKKCER